MLVLYVSLFNYQVLTIINICTVTLHRSLKDTTAFFSTASFIFLDKSLYY